jgi:AraC-like DNA-binding protein
MAFKKNLRIRPQWIDHIKERSTYPAEEQLTADELFMIHLLRVLLAHGGNRDKAARELGISSRTIRTWLREATALGIYQYYDKRRLNTRDNVRA